MKNYRFCKNISRALAALALAAALASCSAVPQVRDTVSAPDKTPAAPAHGFERNVDIAEYGDLAFDEWTLSPPQELLPDGGRLHTLLIYMNGSDLESETAAGTSDLRELKSSGVDESAVNIVVFTGGANRWHTGEVPSGECAVSVLRGGELRQLGTVGQRDMGNAGTLASFIAFGQRCFPAEKTSLILWDHGGGSIAGYGADENFDMSTLTLRELEYAFERGGLAENRLSILGFDACLMATVEMAVIASRYAGLLVASEGLEPGDGWDYGFTRLLGDSAVTDEELAAAVCDSFYDFYGKYSAEELTLSVVRTGEAANVMGALGLFAAECEKSLESGYAAALQASRAGAKSFGDGSPLDMTSDMVDIADLARALSDKFPAEAQNVQNALSRAVLYNVYSSDRELGGLSVYHIYSERRDAARSLEVYRALEMDDAYTSYLAAFAAALPSRNTESAPENPPVTARLLGGDAELFETSKTAAGTLCSVPVNVNGSRAEALVLSADGAMSLLGYRRRDGYMIQKGYDEFEDGDTLEILKSDGSVRAEGELFVYGGGGFRKK